MRFTIVGTEGSPGSYRGAAILRQDGVPSPLANTVVIAPTAAPDLAGSLAFAGAVVCDVGSPLGNLAIVARELGIPLVLHATGATRLIQTGDLVSVDACRGLITVEHH